MLYSELSDTWYFFGALDKLYFLGGEGHDTQGTKLSVAWAAAEKILGLFPGKWVTYYPVISALETGFKIASAAEGFFSFV